MRGGTAPTWAVQILAPVLSREDSIGQAMATRILSTDPRSEEVWAAINGETDGARLPSIIPIFGSWPDVLEQLQRANPDPVSTSPTFSSSSSSRSSRSSRKNSAQEG